jgi:glycosyltransferase involved in cell wall biosynthesis
MDVIIPTFRCDITIIEQIINLPSTENVSTMFIIIVDNPEAPNRKELQNLEVKYSSGKVPKVRVRFNKTNTGASMTRNVRINESSADWIIFLDDDILVEHDNQILIEYSKCINKNPKAGGFIGTTRFPQPVNWRQRGVVDSGIVYFWDIAQKMNCPPWGVTANLCTQRTEVRFHDDFVKTGGGEDVAFCIDTESF